MPRRGRRPARLPGPAGAQQPRKTRIALNPTGAQTVHMPFGEVYTSLQTRVVNVAENRVNVYLANKHYEVAPVLSLTQHEANNNAIWLSEKAWSSFSDQERKRVQAAAEEVGRVEYAVFFIGVAFTVLFPHVVLWLPKQFLPESVGCFRNPIGTG